MKIELECFRDEATGAERWEAYFVIPDPGYWENPNNPRFGYGSTAAEAMSDLYSRRLPPITSR